MNPGRRPLATSPRAGWAGLWFVQSLRVQSQGRPWGPVVAMFAPSHFHPRPRRVGGTGSAPESRAQVLGQCVQVLVTVPPAKAHGRGVVPGCAGGPASVLLGKASWLPPAACTRGRGRKARPKGPRPGAEAGRA